MVTGKVLRFDQVRGYGFIAPDTGSADVFLHANDIWDDKTAVRPGTIVEFQLEEGDRGPKASEVRIVEQAPPTVRRGESPHDDDMGDVLCEVLSSTEFEREITELLINKVPTLTGAQIAAIRRELSIVASNYKWIEN